MAKLRSAASKLPRRSLLVTLLLVTIALPLCLSPHHAAASAAIRKFHLPLAARRAHPPAGPYYQGEFGYGLNLCNTDVRAATEIGFGYVKLYARWADCEPRKGAYTWNGATASLQHTIAAAAASGVRIVLRVDTPPSWAAPGSGNRPPTNPADFGDFMGAFATHMKGQVAAYEIWNEPNLNYEWGNMRPNPERYTELLKAAYPKIKAADPRVVVLTAGLASTGGDGGVTALNDVEFIDRMYRAGAKGYFDALGSHPYGFASPPETRNPNHVTDFRRAADQHAVMERYGDGAKQIWATEFGWLIDPSEYGHPEYLGDPLWSGRQWQKVSAQTQADYLVRAYQYAYANWPWMGVMLLFNYDFSTAGWYPPAEPMRWYAILNPDFSPRPAYNALKAMPKPSWR